MTLGQEFGADAVMVGSSMRSIEHASKELLEINMGATAIGTGMNSPPGYDQLHGLMILKNACIVLATRCIQGIKANRERCRQYVENSIGLVTALNPVLGYEKSVAVAKEALETGRSVYELTLEKGWLSKKALDEILSPEGMTHPCQVPGTQQS